MFCCRLANGESIDELIGGPSAKNCKAAVAQITEYWGKDNKKDKATASNEASK
eukprot:COSAG06_NODE_23298_length_696_cov_2.103853_1_plen_52_part_10